MHCPVDPAGAVADTAVKGTLVPLSSLGLRRYVEPAYPRDAAVHRVAGWVDVAFTVDASGRTRDVRVLRAYPPQLFDAVALAAVRRWRFAPSDAPSRPANSGIRLRFNPE